MFALVRKLLLCLQNELTRKSKFSTNVTIANSFFVPSPDDLQDTRNAESVLIFFFLTCLYFRTNKIIQGVFALLFLPRYELTSSIGPSVI